MESQEFLYNAPMDVAIRNIGIWPYFCAYGLLFLCGFAVALPPPFHLPLVAQHERTYAASAWAFLGAYPLFHALMRPRALRRFGRPASQFVAAALGILVVVTIAWFMQAEMPDRPRTPTGRALVNPVGAAAFLMAASCAVSLGFFLVIEPLRQQLVHRLWNPSRTE